MKGNPKRISKIKELLSFMIESYGILFFFFEVFNQNMDFIFSLFTYKNS